MPCCLSGGDYLLWRGGYQEKCIQIAHLKAQAGFPERNLDMLTGSGGYTALAAQLVYDPGVYAQIATATIQSGKALPNKAVGDQLSLVQGPFEVYHDFVSRLLQLAGKLFGDSDQAILIVKQLAFEMPINIVRKP